jgi:hypothetical protein
MKNPLLNTKRVNIVNVLFTKDLRVSRSPEYNERRTQRRVRAIHGGICQQCTSVVEASLSIGTEILRFAQDDMTSFVKQLPEVNRPVLAAS